MGLSSISLEPFAPERARMQLFTFELKSHKMALPVRIERTLPAFQTGTQTD